MTEDSLISGLPGEEFIREGLADLRAGRRTIPALLAAIGLPRLRRAGLAAEISAPPEPELQLYRLLRAGEGDAYSRYNALLRRLISFEQALDHAASKNRE